MATKTRTIVLLLNEEQFEHKKSVYLHTLKTYALNCITLHTIYTHDNAIFHTLKIF